MSLQVICLSDCVEVLLQSHSTHAIIAYLVIRRWVFAGKSTHWFVVMDSVIPLHLCDFELNTIGANFWQLSIFHFSLSISILTSPPATATGLGTGRVLKLYQRAGPGSTRPPVNICWGVLKMQVIENASNGKSKWSFAFYVSGWFWTEFWAELRLFLIITIWWKPHVNNLQSVPAAFLPEHFSVVSYIYRPLYTTRKMSVNPWTGSSGLKKISILYTEFICLLSDIFRVSQLF